MRVDESSLTGESVPVEKKAEPVLAAETPIAERAIALAVLAFAVLAFGK